MKDWLIAHRGAQSDGRENTLAAFKACQKYPLGWLELDLHTTKDGIVVCHHDFDIAGVNIKNTGFKELLKLDPELATFDEALAVTDPNTPKVVEIKSLGTAKSVGKIIKANPSWRVASYYVDILNEVAGLGINRDRLFLLQHRHPICQLKKIKQNGYGGIGIKQAYATPLLLWRCHRYGLKIYIYTINSIPLAKIYRRFFPYVGLCTNRPDAFSKLD